MNPVEKAGLTPGTRGDYVAKVQTVQAHLVLHGAEAPDNRNDIFIARAMS